MHPIKPQIPQRQSMPLPFQVSYTSITPTSTSPFLASSPTVFCSDFSSFSSAGLLTRFFATCAILLTEPWRCIGGGAVALAEEPPSAWEDVCSALGRCG